MAPFGSHHAPREALDCGGLTPLWIFVTVEKLIDPKRCQATAVQKFTGSPRDEKRLDNSAHLTRSVRATFDQMEPLPARVCRLPCAASTSVQADDFPEEIVSEKGDWTCHANSHRIVACCEPYGPPKTGSCARAQQSRDSSRASRLFVVWFLFHTVCSFDVAKPGPRIEHG